MPATLALSREVLTKRLRCNSRMLFFLRKFIEALFVPLGFCGLVIVAGIVFRRRWIAILGVVLLYAFSTHAVGRFMQTPLEHVYEPKSVAAAPNADAIVVLSGAVVRGITAPGVQWGDSANRYFGGFDLAMAGKAKLLVFTGAGTGVPGSPNQGQIMRQTSIAGGIQPERIIVTGKVLTTDDEATAVSRIPGVHAILLVTSALHMPRATLLFRAHGLDVSPFPTDERVLGPWRLMGSEFFPESSGLQRSEGAMREYYGLAVYKLILFFHPLGRLIP